MGGLGQGHNKSDDEKMKARLEAIAEEAAEKLEMEREDIAVKAAMWAWNNGDYRDYEGRMREALRAALRALGELQ